MTRAICLAAVVATALLAGCAHTMTFEPKPTAEGLPAVAKAPLHAGIYYSPQFAKYEHVHQHGKVTTVVPIGEASVQYLDKVFGQAFARTTRIDKPSGEELAAKGIDVVVSASLEHFDFPYGMAPYSPRYSVVYRTTISTPAGVPVASWVVAGTANHFKMFRAVDGIVEAYMADAGAKLLREFERRSAAPLSAIAQNRAGKSAPVDVSSLAVTARRADLDRFQEPQATRLRAAGIVLVGIECAQKSQRALVVRTSDMHLRMKDGREIAATTPSLLSELLATADGRIDYFYPSLLGIAVVAGASMDWHEQRERLHANAGKGFFGDRILREGKAESGMVVFRLPKDANPAEATAVLAWAVDPDTADGAQVEIPLAAAR